MKNIIGENIKKLRLNEGLTQKQLGEALGVSQAVVGFWESGRNLPKDENIKELALFFAVSPADLRGEVSDSYIELVTQHISDDTQSQRLATAISQLNYLGKDKVIEYAKDISGNPKYNKNETE